MNRRTNALLTFSIGTILVVAIIAVVVWNFDKFLAAVGLGQDQPEAEMSIQPASTEGWHDEALCIERIAGVDILIMRENENTASACFVMSPEMSVDDSFHVTELAIAALNVLASDEVQHIVVSCVTEPEGEDPRYLLGVGVVCEREEGHIQGCESYSLVGGYLSPDSVWWPGIGE